MEDLDVWLSDAAGQTTRIGVARFTWRHGRVSTVFSYDPSYLGRPGAFAVDPNLALVSGGQYSEGLPKAFQDCSPDRWGRNLITKQIRAQQAEAGQTPREISDIDFLVGVSDLTRQGALRFTARDETTFVGPDHDVPKLVALPRLLSAADRVSRSDDMAAIKDLLDAGSGSLGGARPKASVVDDNGALSIAKFPHHNDEWDMMAWEKTALDLADRSGIRVPDRRLVQIDGHGVLLLRRFDRTAQGRVPYVSAMTMISGTDGGTYDYVDIAEMVSYHSSATVEDLEELFRRAAFSVAINNTDDHLRNHGFLHLEGGWQISPVFDVNPNPEVGRDRVTSIGASHLHQDTSDGLARLAEACRLYEHDIRRVIDHVLAGVADWRSIAAANGVTSGEIERFDGCFAYGTRALSGLGGPSGRQQNTTLTLPSAAGSAGAQLRDNAGRFNRKINPPTETP